MIGDAQRAQSLTVCEARMSTDTEHQSMPQLYGAAAHGPRRMATVHSEPPVCPDDLPLEHFRSSEERALALQLFPRSYSSQVVEAPPMAYGETSRAGEADAVLRGRPLLLRALAGRLLRTKGHWINEADRLSGRARPLS